MSWLSEESTPIYELILLKLHFLLSSLFILTPFLEDNFLIQTISLVPSKCSGILHKENLYITDIGLKEKIHI